MSVLCGGMFVTKIARSFRLLIREIFNALSIDPRAWTFLKKTLISIRIIMELDEGHCYWLVIRGVREDDGDEKEKVAEEHIEAYRDIGCEADYPPYGYTGRMHDGYEYHFHTAPNGPN
nr:hypothetical protein [Tanacetum cinerariifolium]